MVWRFCDSPIVMSTGIFVVYAHKLILSFKKGCNSHLAALGFAGLHSLNAANPAAAEKASCLHLAAGSGIPLFPSQSPAVTALPEGEPRLCHPLHSMLSCENVINDRRSDNSDRRYFQAYWVTRRTVKTACSQAAGTRTRPALSRSAFRLHSCSSCTRC